MIWCRLTLGESKADVLAQMGAPHGNTVAAWAAKNLPGVNADMVEWDGVGNDIFSASFVSARADNLQAYDGSIGPNGAKDISCPAFRH